MATTVKTDVASELNITARRNDTFLLKLTVKDEAGAILAMDGTQTNDSDLPVYQAKMTIATQNGDAVLSIYSTFWNDEYTNEGEHTINTLPTSSTEGHWSGTNTALGTETAENTAIHLQGQISGSPNSGQVTITVPYNYMDFQSGNYKYDLQISKNPAADSISAIYTTWLFGSFTLNPDITQV